jgi:hypothetical protein
MNDYFDVGSRTHGRDTFLCAASHMDVANAAYAGVIFCQRKYPKESPPYAAFTLRSSVLKGFAPTGHKLEGISLSLQQIAASLPQPFGRFPP